jgi:hypothetical protein
MIKFVDADLPNILSLEKVERLCAVKSLRILVYCLKGLFFKNPSFQRDKTLLSF